MSSNDIAAADADAVLTAPCAACDVTAGRTQAMQAVSRQWTGTGTAPLRRMCRDGEGALQSWDAVHDRARARTSDRRFALALLREMPVMADTDWPRQAAPHCEQLAMSTKAAAAGEITTAEIRMRTPGRHCSARAEGAPVDGHPTIVARATATAVCDAAQRVDLVKPDRVRTRATAGCTLQHAGHPLAPPPHHHNAVVAHGRDVGAVAVSRLALAAWAGHGLDRDEISHGEAALRHPPELVRLGAPEVDPDNLEDAQLAGRPLRSFWICARVESA